MKTAVFISGSGTNLQAIIDHVRIRELPCRIALVVSNEPSAFGLERARRAGIDTAVVDHRDFRGRADFDRALQQVLDTHGVEALFLAGFMRILTNEFVEPYRGRMLNIHPSLLPVLKGLDTHRRVIEEGHEFHGASVHFVTPELDSGPVIIRGRLRVGENPTVASLAERVHRLEHRIYPQAVEWFVRGRIRLEDGTVYLDGEPLPPEGREILESEL
jgi:phosphoribosylglycinamide formyltransferase-1